MNGGRIGLGKLDRLNIGLCAEPERPDKRNVVAAGRDVVVMHRETNVVDRKSVV